MDVAEVLVSVRGRAEELIEPDRLTVQSQISRTGASKREALSDLGAAVGGLEDALRAASAVSRSTAASGASWTWWVRATTTAPEYDTDPTARMRLTGRTTATVTVMSTLTDLARLEALTSLLDAQEGLHVQTVTWAVDAANPAWRRVRATAIAAAMAKAHDYADALGGQLLRLEHIADSGLLGAGDSARVSYSGSYQAASSHGPQGSPPLDPEPQPVTAYIEARFTASGISIS